MKKDRDMYFENQNQGYFTNPGMMNPMMPNGSMYSNGMMQMGPNTGYGNMNYQQAFPNYPNNQMYNPNVMYNFYSLQHLLFDNCI